MLIIPPDEYAPYYASYISKVKADNIMDSLSESREKLVKNALKISDEQAEFRYVPEKWSVKEVLQHIIDAERVFGYRALCIARGEKQSLPGFDENSYALHVPEGRKWHQIIEEFEAVRNATERLFESFNEQQLLIVGVANNTPVSVRAIGALIVGHELHHLEVLNTRYGLDF